MSKTCTRCKIEKPLDEFSRQTRTKSGYRGECKSCAKLYARSESAKASQRKTQAKYMQTEHGKTKSREKCARYRKKQLFKDSVQKSRAKYPERRSAQIALWNAVQSGGVTRPDVCSLCNCLCIPEGHHFDYSRPLDVIWLCKMCHEAAHHVS